MRVTLDDDGHVYFDDQRAGSIDDTDLRIVDYEKLQAYIAAASEAFDALSSYNLTFEGDQDFDFPSGVFYHLFSGILHKVGD